MRFLIHILRSVSYLTLLPYLVCAQRESFSTDMPGLGSFPLFIVAGITVLLIIGYGNTLAEKKNPHSINPTFWISGILFYLIIASRMTALLGHESFKMAGTILTHLHDAFLPRYEPYLASDAVAELAYLMMIFWMPIAAILSTIVFAERLYKSRVEAKPSAQPLPLL